MIFPIVRLAAARGVRSAAFTLTLALAASIADAAAQAPAQGPPPVPPANATDAGAGASPPGQGTEDASVGSPVAKLIAANLGNLKKITPELIALVNADPALAAGIIEAAQQHPEKAEALAGLLSQIQTGLKATNPDGAKVVAAIVASAPAPFQAAYAVAQADGGGGSAPSTADAGGSAASSGGGGGGAPGTGGGGSAGGGSTGGGTTSSGGFGFGSSFGGSIGGGGGGGGSTAGLGGGSSGSTGGSGGNGGGSNNPGGSSGGGNALTLSQVFAQLIADYEMDPASVSASNISDFGQQLQRRGVNPNDLTAAQYEGLLEVGAYFLDESPSSFSSDQISALLVINNVTTGTVTRSQVMDLLVREGMPANDTHADTRAAQFVLGGYAYGETHSPEQVAARLAAFGVNLQGSLNATTVEQLRQAMVAAGYTVSITDVKLILSDNRISLADYVPPTASNGGGPGNGGNNPPLHNLNQLATQFLVNNNVDPTTVTPEQLAGWRQWMTSSGLNPDDLTYAQYTELLGQAQALVELGVDAPLLVTLDSNKIAALDHTVDWLDSHSVVHADVDPNEMSALLILAGVKTGQVSTAELSEVLALAGLTGPATRPAAQLKALLTLSGLTPGQVTPDQLAGFLGKVGVALPGPLSTMTLSEFKVLVRNAGFNLTDQEMKHLLLVAGVELSVFKGYCSGVVSRSTPCG